MGANVKILTHRIAASRTLPVLLAIALMFFIMATQAATQWQDPKSLEAAARSYAEEKGLKLGTRQTIEAGPIDERVRLVQCPQGLATASAPGVRTAAKLIVEVRCPTAGGWRVFVPVRVKAFDRALVATRALERGHVLNATDVTLMESETTQLPGGYFRDVAAVEGHRLERAVTAGAVLSPSVLAVKPTISRGQTVTAVASNGGIAVRVQAVALNSAGTDERIKLRNLASGREIEGIVRSDSVVEVALP